MVVADRIAGLRVLEFPDRGHLAGAQGRHLGVFLAQNMKQVPPFFLDLPG